MLFHCFQESFSNSREQSHIDKEALHDLSEALKEQVCIIQHLLSALRISFVLIQI